MGLGGGGDRDEPLARDGRPDGAARRGPRRIDNVFGEGLTREPDRSGPGRRPFAVARARGGGDRQIKGRGGFQYRRNGTAVGGAARVRGRGLLKSRGEHEQVDRDPVGTEAGRQAQQVVAGGLGDTPSPRIRLK